MQLSRETLDGSFFGGPGNRYRKIAKTGGMHILIFFIMTELALFPLQDYWTFYLGFTAFVLVILALDLGVFHREAHEVSFREALTWSIIWVVLALMFNLGFYFYAEHQFSQDARLLAIPGFSAEVAARQSALEFLTGYVVEKSLAVDNIFVFVVVFSFFPSPPNTSTASSFSALSGLWFFASSSSPSGPSSFNTTGWSSFSVFSSC